VLWDRPDLERLLIRGSKTNMNSRSAAETVKRKLDTIVETGAYPHRHDRRRRARHGSKHPLVILDRRRNLADHRPDYFFGGRKRLADREECVSASCGTSIGTKRVR